jgi:hypothetical protein
VFKTPSLHEDEIRKNIPDDVRRHIDYLYNSGQHRLVNSYIREVATEQDIGCLKKYLNKLEKFKTIDSHVITTHRRLLHMDNETLSKFDVIIIDEDIILKSIIPNQVQITLSDFKRLPKTMLKEVDAGRIKLGKYKQLCKKIKKLLKLIETETLFHIPYSFEWYDDDKEDGEKDKKEAIDGTSTPIDVPSFCLAEYFYFRKASREQNLSEDTIVFLKPSKLKEGHKYIMISATADEDICNKYFGNEKVTFHECKKAEYVGTLNQYYDKSMSRTCIHDNHGIIEHIKKVTGVKHTITFKEFAQNGELYFGNNEGVDYLKGQNIDVIGTPYYAEFLYKLFPYTIGLEFNKNAKPMPNLPATHNGYRFRFTTYDDEVLQNIQFWTIESDLEQAIGRARLLRKNCTVNLFSIFPLAKHT